jgi:hypothetical protein
MSFHGVIAFFLARNISRIRLQGDHKNNNNKMECLNGEVRDREKRLCED